MLRALALCAAIAAAVPALAQLVKQYPIPAK